MTQKEAYERWLEAMGNAMEMAEMDPTPPVIHYWWREAQRLHPLAFQEPEYSQHLASTRPR